MATRLCSLTLVMVAGTTVALGFVYEARAAESPLAPLAAPAAVLERGFEQFLAGRSVAEAFAPLPAVDDRSEDIAAIRAALQADRVVRVRSISTEFELVLRRNGIPQLYLRTGVDLNPNAPALVSLRGHRITPQYPLNVAAFPLQRYTGGLAGFAEAAEGLLGILSSGNCTQLPFADPSAIAAGLPAGVVDDVLERLELAKRKLPGVCASINDLDPDEVYLRLDDVAHVALNAEGVATGVIRSGFGFGPSGVGPLNFGVTSYLPFESMKP